MSTNNSWNNSINSGNNPITLNSGTSSLSISTDASATTVNIATGAAVKTITLGSTNTTSSTAIKSGTGNVAINSGVTVDSTGRSYNTVQPAFFAYAPSSQTNVTGDGTLYTCTFTTKLFDQNSNFDGTSTFTAPITGKYFFNSVVYLGDLTTTNTTRLTIVATAGTAQPYYQKATAMDTGFLAMNGDFFINMTAGDTCVVKVYSGGGTKIVDVVGAAAPPFYSTFSGYLVC